MNGRIFEFDEPQEPKKPAPSSPTQTAAAPPPPPKSRRSWRGPIYAGCALLILALIGGAAFSIWKFRKSLQAVIAPAPIASPTPAPSLAATPKTKFETFTAKYGRVLIRGATPAGTISGLGGTLTVEAVQMTDASTNEKVEAIVFQITPSGYFRTPNTSAIDYDEIDSLLKGLDYVAKTDASITPLKSFQAVYKSRGDFQVGTFSDDKGKISAVLASGEITPARVFLKLEELAKVRDQIMTAKGTLDSVRLPQK